MMFKATFLVLMGCVSVLSAPTKIEKFIYGRANQKRQQNPYAETNGYTTITSTSTSSSSSSTSTTSSTTTEGTPGTSTNEFDEENDDTEIAIEVIRNTIEEILGRVNDAISNEEFSSIIEELNTFIDKAFPDRNLANHRYS